MPLDVTDYTWSQTDSTIHLSVPLKGATVRKVDIVSTEEYLKVHFPPFLFEAFLFEPVDDDRSTARIGNGVAVFTLPKKTCKVWERLMITTDDKETKKEIRERALLKQQQKLSAESKQKGEKQQAEKKYALETMMKLEKEERDRIEKMKEAEREKTTAELAAWQLRQKQKAEEAQQKQNHQIQQAGSTDIPGNRLTDIVKNKQDHRNSKTKKIQPQLPPPRRCGNIAVTFTPRVFPTALRESLVPEEEEWLKKQAEARRAVSAEVEELQDLTEEERNHDWLKQKGDKCFTNGDYVGAVNAYSLGIRLNGKIPALYSNRAACHLKLRNLHKAIEDSSKALDLLTPAVPANSAARVRASIRRGSAFCQLQLYAEGLQDYEAALKIDPHNEALQEDAQIIRDIIQGSAGQNETQ
ncbi:dynein assembly factor 4, axonemal isoform X1 [Girardinichthys multiradiatus]|uniref:dynein assembly factor 4, axonemal isoform X1 n=1 Tax=Girardinichthys multiradiatus TaxID=208333 RepID=UPI001FAE09BF|nr:dynein assembly factor 4, axonemal isoform X1 [Girardinichthys multiradiatus]XP_047200781.1 dynein assembly factor 4, axonemal isoform X1 [Girardinichthys multiradiatus]XP_047200789.1 dynein assembly factor 4, axonemal isoform X1 [Girardinichthys multiradiatus]